MTTSESDWVELSPRFTPGWPWPEDSWGLGPMYGESGWCRACGTPKHEQIGPLIIQGTRFPKADVWMPNWRYNAVCVSADIADEVAARFKVLLRAVEKPRGGTSGAVQILPVQTEHRWHKDDDLSEAIIARHSQWEGTKTGATCAECGVWRWLPISESEVPITASALGSSLDLITSPEWFGDGWRSFQHMLVRRPLAEFLRSATPRNWEIRELVLS